MARPSATSVPGRGASHLSAKSWAVGLWYGSMKYILMPSSLSQKRREVLSKEPYTPPVVSGSEDQNTIISVCLRASSRRSYCSGMPRRCAKPHMCAPPHCHPSQLSGLCSP